MRGPPLESHTVLSCVNPPPRHLARDIFDLRVYAGFTLGCCLVKALTGPLEPNLLRKCGLAAFLEAAKPKLRL